MQASEEQPIPGKFKEWKALLGPGVIVVDFYAMFRTAGWSVELVKPDDQPDDPEHLVLERVLTVPEGYQPPVIRGIDVHWEEKTEHEYKTVTIQPDGVTIDVVDMRNAPPPPKPERKAPIKP